MTPPPAPLPLPDPPLRDGDVQLRPWRLEDAPALAAAWTDPEIERWTGVPPQRDETVAARWIRGDADRRARGLSLDLVVELDGAVVGEVGLVGFEHATGRAEIGWWTAAEGRGRGVASRAAALVAEWAVSELDLDLLVAVCDAGNPASGAVARSAGFHLAARDGTVERWVFGPAAGATLHP